MRMAIILLLFATNLYGQNKDGVQSFVLHSAILNENRFFDIYVPLSPKGKLEVLYVLNGQAQFATVLKSLKSLKQDQKIVVGIGNIWLRDRDYTPTKIISSPFVDGNAAKVSGGGERFINHLQKELIPYIEQYYPAGNSRILIGHSLGGLIALDILLKQTGMFAKYAVIDPSLWWDDRQLLKESTKLLQQPLLQTALFLAIANTPNKKMDNIEAIRKDTTQNTALIRPSILFLDHLKEEAKKEIQYSWNFYKDHTHMTVFEAACRDALRVLLND